MFDQDHVVWKFKYALLFGMLFLVSIYYSWQELVYLIRGRLAQGTVTESYSQSLGRYGQNKSRVIEYRFAEDGGLQRKGGDTLSMEEQVPDFVLVEYTPGENGRSRIKGHIRWLWLAIFGVSIAGLAWAGYRLNKHIDEAMAPRNKRKK